MFYLLPAFLLVLPLVAVAIQRRMTTRFGDGGCPYGRPNHSLSSHPAPRRIRGSSGAAA
jgi:hypothetical protein